MGLSEQIVFSCSQLVTRWGCFSQILEVEKMVVMGSNLVFFGTQLFAIGSKVDGKSFFYNLGLVG